MVVTLKVTLMLADSAQVSEGKLYVLGGAWNVTGPQPIPSALVMVFEVPWDQTNQKHRFTLDLIDADGRAVTVDSSDGAAQNPIRIEGEFEIGRPAGLKPGTSTNLPMALNLPPQPLKPGQQFESSGD